MPGYDPDFLGQAVPLPDFSPSLIGDVLQKPELTDGIYAHYRNHTIVMNRRLRTPIFTAVNIDQQKIKNVRRANDWLIDTRVGAENQLNNDYYRGRQNRWDRGHLVRRASAAWGDSSREAKLASDDTFFYPNATLQHENFNQDEWLALEDWVKDLTLDSTDKISVISGPIFGEFVRSITPPGRMTALIPSAFFKVVAYINQQNQLEARAFIMIQDEEALRDKEGKQMFNFQRYQVSVTEIEEQTGLIFPSQIPENNPLFFNENSEAREDLNVRRFPEHIEVDSPEEVIGMGERRETVKDEEIPIFIAAALVNPAGNELSGEWVSIINLSNDEIKLDGWKLKDPQNELTIQGALAPGTAIQISPLSPIELGNQSGTISLYNKDNERVDRVKYPVQPKVLEGKPIIFAMRELSISG